MPRRAGPSTRAKVLRVRGPAITTRGPRVLQRALWAQTREASNIPRPENYLGGRADGPGLRQILSSGSEPEWRIFWALLTFGLWPDADYFYQQSAFGGRQLLGGAVLDYGLPWYSLALNVQGTFWHARTTALQGADRLLRARLAGTGVTLIFLDEQDCMQRPQAVTRAAMQGQDWSRLSRNL